jgi:hypothetical protein
MRRWMMRIRLLAAGGVMLGFLQGAGATNFAEILFEFLLSWVSIVINALLGGSAGELSNGVQGILA